MKKKEREKGGKEKGGKGGKEGKKKGRRIQSTI